MKNLNLIQVENIDHLVRPDEFNDLTIDSSAIDIFTDFKQHKPLVIDVDASADEALYVMKKTHVRLRLVVDSKDEMIGTISLQELDQQYIQILQNKGINRQDITVKDLMTPRSKLTAIRYRELIKANIRDVLETLKKNGKLHCLVVDINEHHIRGIISASDIARRLHIPLEIEKPTTFVDIFDALKPEFN